MHEEDNSIGLCVQNPRGEKWMAYGDRRALDQANINNLERCVRAVQMSADEVYTAYKTKQVPPMDEYQALNEAPTLESAAGPQVLAPMVTSDGKRRNFLTNRTLWEFTKFWTFLGTALSCRLSGWWAQPITINGPTKVRPWTPIAATSSGPEPSCARVYYQNLEGGILESMRSSDSWVQGVHRQVLAQASPRASLTTTSWNEGKEV